MEKGFQFVFRFVGGIFLHVDRVLEHFGIVHGAPAHKTAVVGEGGELIFFDVAMHCLLDVEVFAHRFFYNFNKNGWSSSGL